MKKILLFTLLALFLLGLIEAKKILKPYCGPKTMDIRFCELSDHCGYSDEICNKDGLCVVVEELY